MGKNKRLIEKKRPQDFLNQIASIYDCYDSIDEFTTIGLHPTLVNQTSVPELKTTTCQEYARKITLGKVPYHVHMHRHYQFYVQHLLEHPSKEVYVVRTEFLWNDVKSISDLIGGGFTSEGRSYTHETGEEQVTNRTISQQGILNACYFLCPEIQVYKQLILGALNLLKQDKIDSLKLLHKTCPKEATSTVCFDNTINN